MSRELIVRKNAIAMAIKQVVAASSLVAMAAPLAVYAQGTQPVSQNESAGALEELVVTGTITEKTQLESSVAVTSVDSELIKDFQPSSEAEVFRMIPGIQVAGTSGPGGNSNIAVRGLPVATGGSPFVQIQEDGLPTVLFGDIQFGNNDYWTRFDASTKRVEGLRGGTAGTLASQAPGAIINYVSHTGEEDGGYLSLTTGLGFDENKVDFRYGGAASDSVTYHVGGYVKNGRGPLDAGYNVSDSAQIKANLTKNLDDDKGFVRFFVKAADTQEPNYTGSPAIANYNGSSFSNVRAYPGFDGRKDSNYSIHNQDFLIVNREGDLERVKMNGIATQSFALGNQVHYEFTETLQLDNKMRWTDMSGSFSSPFLNVAKTSGIIGSSVNGETVGEIRYANGPSAGQVYTGDYLNNNTNVRTNIRDLGSFVNDLSLSNMFDLDAGTLTARAGYFYMNQRIAMDWHTNKATSELSGDNPAMLDLYTADGAKLTANGIAGFNNNWGDCCARDYDLAYTDTAPYAGLDFDTDLFTVDASVRYDSVQSSGWTRKGGAEFMTEVDGAQIPTMIANGAAEYLDYSVSYDSWTVGGLFKANEDTSFFIRASQGGRFNSDRQTVSGKINADGSLNQAGKTAAVDEVNQYELGVKRRGDLWAGFYTAEVTLLQGDFKQSTYELSATRCGGAGGCVIDAKYESQGAEILVSYNLDNFSLIGNATISDAKKQAAGSSSWVRADGIPDMIYTLSSTYDISDEITVGLNLTGQSTAIDGAGNEYPASRTWGGFARYRPAENLELGIQGYNLLNDFDLRGNGGLADGSANPTVISGAPAIGRTMMASVKVLF
jgi:outer membrane receptor for Fe3+-dicitrate